jgi:glucose 1-dehydrogenase
MTNLLEGKVAIVTGAGQGIGLDVCRKFLACGARVILNDLDEELAIKASGSLDKLRCVPVAGSADDPDIIRKMIETAVSSFGRLDIAVANAGITIFGDFFDYTPTNFQKVIQTNLQSAFFLTQQAAIQMRQQKSGGAIVLMSSVTAHQAHRNLSAYGMSKAATEMLAKNLVLDLSPHNIRINAVAPGATNTERTLMDKNYQKTWSAITPMGRPATTSDIAEAVCFLVSDQSGHITGQTLVVDGGWTSVSPEP